MASRTLDIIINGRDRSERAVNSARRRVGGLEKAVKRAGIAIATYFSARQAGEFFKDIIGLASDAEEAASKFGFVFEGLVGSTTARLDVFADTAGRSRYELREMAGDFGALIKPMGLTTEQAADMSVELTKLSTDLASFFNTSDQQAMTALRAGLVGESEPLRKYGVQLSAARIEQEAYSRGLIQTKNDLNAAIKAQSAFNIIIQDTLGAQGDAIRTSDSFANMVKDLRGEWTDFRIELGQELLPVAKNALAWINDMNDGLAGLGNTLSLFIAQAKNDLYGFADDIASISPGWKVTEAIGLTSISRNYADAGSQLLETQMRIRNEVEQRDQRRRDHQRLEAERKSQQEADRLNNMYWQGPLPYQAKPESPTSTPDKIELSSVDTVELPNARPPVAPSATGPQSAVTGQFITGLAQIGRQEGIQREMLNVLSENRSTTRELRDIVRQIQTQVENGRGVLVGAFS